MRKLMITAAVTLLATQAAQAVTNDSTNSYYEIKDLAFFSSQDTVAAAWAGYVSVRFTQPLSWANSGCDQTMVAIRGGDKHMISAVQAAFAMGKPLRLYADSDQKIDGPYCILRAVQY